MGRDATIQPGTAQSAGPGPLNAANAITLARLCLVPLAVWLVVHGRDLAAFWLFLVAGISDGIDGWLARRQGGSALGAILDPAADKALLVSMYVALAAMRVLPDWLAFLVVFRDVAIVGGVLALTVLGQRVAIRPLRISKLNTVLQILLVGAALLWPALRLDHAWLAPLVWLVAASTVASGAAYAVGSGLAWRPPA